ncbi:hypothetical protein [uncultured Desulfuromonas sp.]|uniref:hypothetical protein n=1 Tax=uncultured Desulfuromonas sp. TaxID=181013 RepID=UPI002AAB355B|nr:hypothetical protein [uncultured Desulfuromonas sp.]
MKKVLLALLAVLTFAVPAMAIDFAFHGDFSNEFRLYSNQSKFFTGDFGYKTTRTAAIADDTTSDSFASAKYRLWTETATDDGNIKGVFAVEIGGIHYGDNSRGGGFSGDGVNVETRWAYTDFALAGGRLKVGLQPVKINKFFWTETATGVNYKIGNFEAAWYRGYEVYNTSADSNDFKDLDALYVRYNLTPAEGVKVGLFGVWQTSDGMTSSDIDALEAAEATAIADLAAAELAYNSAPSAATLEALVAAQEDLVAAEDAVPGSTGNYLKKMTGYDLDLYTLGVDGGLTSGSLFVNWDLMYQTGDLAEDLDFGGYFAHLDVGAKMGDTKITYTFWYASGDDDSTDGDYDAFIATDCDTKGSDSSIVLFEGYTSDNYFSAVPYVQDKGLILNRIGIDQKLSDKLTVGAAALYLMTAEDIEYATYSEDKIGFELDAYASYKMYQNLELAIQAGYLAADDAMDFYEADNDGNADEDLYVINSKIRYKF